MNISKLYFPILIVFIIIGSSSYGQIAADEQIPDLNYFIVPGTMSYRTDNSSSPGLSHPDTLIRGRYYGYDDGGARTWWNSSQYKDFTFFQHPTNPNWITDPNQVNKLPKAGNGGYNSSGNPNKWLGLNFRIAYPSETHYNLDTASRETLYPLILFMHGAGERADCWGNNCYGEDDPNMWNNDHNLVHGGRQHKDAINRDPSHPRHWPGFVVFPQNKNGYNPGRGLDTWTGRTIALVEKLLEVYPIDPNRIYIHGLSEGAQGAWMLITSRPDLFAAAAPMSGHRNNGAFDNDAIAMDTSMIHIPIWQFQGGKDNRPTPEGTGNKINKLKNLGGTPRYTIYPNLGHGVWNTAYEEPDFFSWFLQYTKLTIHSYYGISEVCEGDPVNVRLGISKGFDGYEWRKNKDGVITSVSPSPERDNEIIADELASYQVRIQRDGVWSEWSDPYTLTSKLRPVATIDAQGSTALPGLDGATEVTLTTPQDGIFYTWKKDGVLYLEDSTLSEITVSDPGAYTVIKKDAGLCNSTESDPAYVSNEPFGSGTPNAPDNLYASASSESSINIYWQDKSFNEIGFEVYRSLDNINYEWVATTDEDVLLYNDVMLDGDTEYFYKVRAYNENGASAASNVASATTILDDQNPTAPSGFKFVSFDYTEYRLNIDGNNYADEHFEVHPGSVILNWNPSTDNVGIDRYDVYFGDGTLAGTTTDTTIVISGLDQNRNYNFHAVAVDNNGNFSSPSSSSAVTTTFDGLYYNLYAGGTWDVIREFSDWALFDDGFGNISTFDIYGAKSGKYEDNDYFGYEFFGYLYIETEGTYTFSTRSDDGSQLWIGNKMLVDNDGLHGMRTVSSIDTLLTVGAHPITVKFFERSGGQGLEVRYVGPGIPNQQIPASALRSGPLQSNTPPAPPANLAATAQAADYAIDLTWDNAPTEIVILGSSTAEGYGLGGDKSWVDKLDSTLLAQNAVYNITNLAKGGYNTFHIRANGSDGGGFSGAPDVTRNITQALSLNPDIIIVNLPSNNVANNIDISTTINHYLEYEGLADAEDVQIFFTTTQPRDFSDMNKRQLLEDEADAVRLNFGQRVIDIYDELTDFSNNRSIKSQYALGDGVHLNTEGHHYIFTKVLQKVGPYITKFEVYESKDGGEFNIVRTSGYSANALTVDDLDPSTAYDYKLKAVNIFGSSTFSNTASAVTIGDNEAPSQPQNVTLRSKTSSKVSLSWDNSTDNVGVAEYIITYDLSSGGSSGSRNSNAKTQASSVNSPNNGVTIENLSPETEYSFTVSAVDASANRSSESTPLIVTTNAEGALPVELIDFDYSIENGIVNLNWKTLSEKNNSHFEIQRGADTSNFKLIGEKSGAGDSNSEISYTFKDLNPLTTNFYRLKQVDLDGKFAYSNILRVEIAGDPFEDLKLYPNPTNGQELNIKGRVQTANDKVLIEFIDVVGKSQLSLETDNRSLDAGVSIDLSRRLKPGIYLVLLTDGITVSQKKLVIQ
ncbi:fibronectin type III domain-containing protein [Fulvivirga aurantia]|uniref:fibronectin type III domain-containing protein n=1 Tax=Fulvivirga aurantia TaxID=2529383 RepID=UPI0016284564|nr:fibronectin type III domain-containing protein [Fulvivirga aurantia]